MVHALLRYLHILLDPVVNLPQKPATVCEQGCAMSCVSMALNGWGIVIDGQASTPGKQRRFRIGGVDHCVLTLDRLLSLIHVRFPQQLPAQQPRLLVRWWRLQQPRHDCPQPALQ